MYVRARIAMRCEAGQQRRVRNPNVVNASSKDAWKVKDGGATWTSEWPRCCDVMVGQSGGKYRPYIDDKTIGRNRGHGAWFGLLSPGRDTACSSIMLILLLGWSRPRPSEWRAALAHTCCLPRVRLYPPSTEIVLHTRLLPRDVRGPSFIFVE